MTNTTEPKKKPDHIRDGALTITEWHNKSEKGFEYPTYTFQRSYRDDKGLWQNTDSFRRGDLLKMARLCIKAYDKAGQTSEVDENG